MDVLEELKGWAQNTSGDVNEAFRKAVSEIERLRAENAELQRKAGIDRLSGPVDEFNEHMKGKTGQ